MSLGIELQRSPNLSLCLYASLKNKMYLAVLLVVKPSATGCIFLV